MPTLRFRMTASDNTTNTVINAISSLEGVHSVEEVADLMPHMDDADSSSLGLSDDKGPGSHAIEVETSNDTVLRRAREVAEAEAHAGGAGLEFVDNF